MGFCDSEQFRGTKCQMGRAPLRRPHQDAGRLWVMRVHHSLRPFNKLTKSQEQAADRGPPVEGLTSAALGPST